MQGEANSAARVQIVHSAATRQAPPHRPISKTRRAAFAAAERNSRIVAVLRKLLPTIAIALLLIFTLSALSFFLLPVSGIKLSQLGLSDGQLVMRQPRVSGFDEQDRPFDVSASKAIQNLLNPREVHMEDIDAKVPFEGDTQADVSAKNGVFNTDSDKLVLRNDVVIKNPDGLEIRLDEAYIDMKTGALTSERPVEVTTTETDISADSVVVEDNGKVITFTNRVKMIIRKPISRGNPETQ